MNSNIIPLGPQETITNGAVTKKALIVTAETDLVITNLVYEYPAAPPGTGVVAGFTLKAGRNLFRVKSCNFTGTATILYSGQ